MVLTVLLMARTSAMVGDTALDAHEGTDNQCGTDIAIATNLSDLIRFCRRCASAAFRKSPRLLLLGWMLSRDGLARFGSVSSLSPHLFSHARTAESAQW